MTLIAIVIPWRPGQPDREHHHAAVRAHLRALLPDALHLDADSGAQPFSRAGSRNLGVQLAEQSGVGISIICDADTMPQPEPLYAAIEQAGDGCLHLPYTRYRGLSPHGTWQWQGGTPVAECHTELETSWSTGGVLVITPDAWRRAGGMDERFAGWGFEDAAFRIACDAILGPTVRHEGTITHLWHPSEIDPHTVEYQTNRALAARYDSAEGDPAAIRILVDEHRHTLQPAR